MFIKRVVKDLIVISFAVLTSGLIAYLLALVETKLRFSVSGFSYDFIPVGALGSGALAASGYYFGFRLFPHRLTRLLAIAAIVFSAATYFFVSYLDYSMLHVGEIPISRLIPFGKYLTMSIEHRQMWLNFSSFSPGPFNYLLVAVQIAGFAVGGFVVVRGLYRMPCCDHCDKILKNPATTQRVSNSLLDLEDLFQRMRTALAEGRSAEALQLATAPNSAPRNAVHKLTLILWKCDRCPVEFFNLFIKPGGEHVGYVRDYCPTRDDHGLKAFRTSAA